MIYRIKCNPELFENWRKWEAETGKFLLSSLIQNDMFLPTERLNESFSEFHKTYLELKDKYSESYLLGLIQLRDNTANYIKELNKVGINKDEFDEFRVNCEHFAGKWEESEALGRLRQDKPVLCYCSHKNNELGHEGNCDVGLCPLLRG